MRSRAEALGRYVACGLALPLAALAADPVGQFQPTHLSVSPDRGAGLQALSQTRGQTNAQRDIPMYAQLYLQGRMNLDDLVSRRISLREVNDGYAALKDGSLNRVVVTSF